MGVEQLAFKERRKAAATAAASGAGSVGVGATFGQMSGVDTSFGDSLGGRFGSSFEGVTGAEASPRYRRLDLRLVPYESYVCSMLYFTGSDEHNKEMRNVAIAKGYKLSEYGLFEVSKGADGNGADGKEVERAVSGLHSEQEVFHTLGMPYKEPHERNI